MGKVIIHGWQKDASNAATPTGPDMPSAEHRGHIRRFLRSPYGDKEDVALRGFVAWKRLNHRLIAAAQAVESGPKRRGKKPRK